MFSASALTSVGRNSISLSSQASNKNIVSFLAWRSARKEQWEEKGGRLPCCLLGKALNGILPSLCGSQADRPSSLAVAVAQSDLKQANRT